MSRYQAIVCGQCEVPHFSVYDVDAGLDGLAVENTHADAHGAWETGFGETPEAAKKDALARLEMGSPDMWKF